MSNIKLRGALCALSTGICWGFSGTVGQYLFTEKGVDRGWLTIVRLFGAGVVLLVYAALRCRGELFTVWKDKRDALRLVAFSVLGLMSCQYTYLAAISYSNAGTATALQYLGQAIIMAVVCIRARRLPTLREGAALLLAMSGVFLLATHGRLDTLVLSPDALLWGLLAALALTLYTLLPGDLLKRYSAPVCTGFGMFIGGAALFLITKGWTLTQPLDLVVVLGAAEIAVVGTALAFTLYLRAIADIGSVNASLLICTEVLFAVLCTAVWLKTHFAAEDVVGIALIVVMAILLALPEREKKK